MPTPLTPAEEEAVKLKIQEILKLLELSSMPEEVKESWIALLPDMNLEQANRLHSILEQELHENIQASAQYPADQKLLDDMEEAQTTYQQNTNAATADAAAQLQEIEDELPTV